MTLMHLRRRSSSNQCWSGLNTKRRRGVRLGLVVVKVVIEELEKEEMQRDPEINKHLQIAMKRHCMPHKFSAEEVKPRSMKTVRW